MLTIRDLKVALGGRTLFEAATLHINYGDHLALVGPNGAGKTTLFSIILKQREPDSGIVERDEWTMVGHLPQESEALGEETVLDVATGRVDELPRLEKRLHELERVGECVVPGIFGGTCQARQAQRPGSGDEGEEDVARPRFSRRGFQPESAGDERRLDYARPSGPAAGARTGPAPAG